MKIIETLKAWRSARGLTQATGAAKLGVPVGTLRDWEQGRRTPKPATWETILRRMKRR